MKQQLQVEVHEPSCLYFSDIPYARRVEGEFTGLKRPLYLQLLTPRLRAGQGGEKLPLVLFLTGGGYRQPKVKLRVPWLVRLAEQGFVVAMPEYRGTETHRFPAMVEDARTALRFMCSHAEEFCIDPQKVVVMGASAGGHIGLLASYTGERFNAPDDDCSVAARVRGVIDLYGPTNITCMSNGEMEQGEKFLRSMGAQFVGCCDPSAFATMAAPTVVTDYITPGAQLPPTLIAHGDADELVPIRQSELLYEALQAAGQEVEFYCLSGADHADMQFFQKEMIERYTAFIRRVTQS